MAPRKEFPVREANRMVVKEYSIHIWHTDTEISLVSFAIDTKLALCFVYAMDMQTGQSYLLRDRIGME